MGVSVFTIFNLGAFITQVTPTAITTVTNTVFLSAVVVTGAGAHQTGASFKIKFC